MEFLLSIGLWIVFGVACAGIAGDKNRSPGWWFFWGIMFGFIALIVIALLPRVEE